MCQAGIPILDLFPMTDSYPKGTGLQGRPFDAVHYEHRIFVSVENVLGQYFRKGNLNSSFVR